MKLILLSKSTKIVKVVLATKWGASYSDSVVKEARKNTLELESLVMSSCEVSNNTKAKCSLKVLCPFLDFFSVLEKSETCYRNLINNFWIIPAKQTDKWARELEDVTRKLIRAGRSFF